MILHTCDRKVARHYIDQSPSWPGFRVDSSHSIMVSLSDELIYQVINSLEGK